MKSGLTDREWIERAEEAWTLLQLKDEISEYRVEIEEIEGLTRRVRGVYVNLAQNTAFEKAD